MKHYLTCLLIVSFLHALVLLTSFKQTSKQKIFSKNSSKSFHVLVQAPQVKQVMRSSPAVPKPVSTKAQKIEAKKSIKKNTEKNTKKIIKQITAKNKPKQLPTLKALDSNNQTAQAKQLVIHGENSPLAKYTSYVRKVVNDHKFYPRIARKLRHQGHSNVEIIIANDGKIISVTFLRLPESTHLAKATKQIFEKIDSFKAFPTELTQTKITILIPIIYRFI